MAQSLVYYKIQVTPVSKGIFSGSFLQDFWWVPFDSGKSKFTFFERWRYKINTTDVRIPVEEH